MILQIFKNPVQKGETLLFFLLGETLETDLFHFIYNTLYAICNIVSLFGKKDLLDPDSVLLRRLVTVAGSMEQLLASSFWEQPSWWESISIILGCPLDSPSSRKTNWLFFSWIWNMLIRYW